MKRNRKRNSKRNSTGRGRSGTLLVVLITSLFLLGCVFSGGTAPGAGVASQDGPVFEGSVPELPGSTGKLVLEKNFQQTRRLRWKSDDLRIGGTEVDFFSPRDWKLEGEPPSALTFADRSPGPVLFGEVLLAPWNRATVTVVLGGERVTYRLRRVDQSGVDHSE
jgi:hypothetical protein